MTTGTPGASSGDRTAEQALLDDGHGVLVQRAYDDADAFVREHATEIATLAEDAHGATRQGGPIRIVTVLLVFPLALPLGLHLIRNPAGFALEGLGFAASVLCVVLAGAMCVLVGGRALDRTTIGIVATAACSTIGGAGLTLWRIGPHWLAVGSIVCAVLMLACWIVLAVARGRAIDVGRLRDTEAMDRSDLLRERLRARLAASVASVDAERLPAFLDDVVAGAVPRPERRLFAKGGARAPR